MSSRRTFMQALIAAGATLAGASRPLGRAPPGGPGGRRVAPANASHRLEDAMPARVVTPDVKDLPFTNDNGVKVFTLTAEPVKRKIAPWKTIDCWGFNGSAPRRPNPKNPRDHRPDRTQNYPPQRNHHPRHGPATPHAKDGTPSSPPN